MALSQIKKFLNSKWQQFPLRCFSHLKEFLATFSCQKAPTKSPSVFSFFLSANAKGKWRKKTMASFQSWVYRKKGVKQADWENIGSLNYKNANFCRTEKECVTPKLFLKNIFLRRGRTLRAAPQAPACGHTLPSALCLGAPAALRSGPCLCFGKVFFEKFWRTNSFFCSPKDLHF